MAKRNVLGNDPFERGAAARPGGPPAKAGEAPATPGRPAPAASRTTSSSGASRTAARATRDGADGARAKAAAEEGSFPAAKNPRRTTPERPVEPNAPPAAGPPPKRGRETPVSLDETRVPTPPTPLHATPSETTVERLRRLIEEELPAALGQAGHFATSTLGLTGMPGNVPDVDPFGMSQQFVDRWQPVFAFLLRHYFRLAADGLGNLPSTGPALLVSNHSGMLPFDEVLIAAALADRHPAHRIVRPLAEDFAIHFPFAGPWLERFGCVRACPENAERLLAGGHLVAVFPEGSHGIGKLWRQRYRLQRFGRGGFVRLALRAQVPIVPIALIGAEESHPVLARIDLPRSLGVPYLPITPTFPWLGPLGLWPLPTRLFLRIGTPIHLGRNPRDADDRPLVARLSEEVRTAVQEMLDGLLAQRRSAFF